jgi:hypothetical protein
VEIPLHGEYTERDIKRGLALMRGLQFKIMGIFMGFIAAGALFSTIVTITSEEMEPLAILGSLLPVAVVLAIFGGIFWLVPYLQFRTVKKAPLFQGTMTGAVTDEALELRSEQAEGKTKWGAFVQYKMSDEIVLLYQNKAAATMVPRSLFAGDEDWQKFQQLIQATVPGKAQRGPRIGLWGVLAILLMICVVLTAIVLALLLGGG